jgi:Zn-dependent protease
LIPINPLDGGKVLGRFLSPSLNQKLEQHQNMTSLLLLILILSGGIQFLAIPVEWTYQMMIHTALGIIS